MHIYALSFVQFWSLCRLFEESINHGPRATQCRGQSGVYCVNIQPSTCHNIAPVRLNCQTRTQTVIFAIRLPVCSTLCTLTNTVETIELWSASVVWLNLYALVCRLYAEEGDSTHLFSWREWVRYVECRKAVVAAHHLPTKTAVYRNTVPHDPQLFVQHYAQTNEHLMDLKQTGKYNDEFLMSN